LHGIGSDILLTFSKDLGTAFHETSTMRMYPQNGFRGNDGIIKKMDGIAAVKTVEFRPKNLKTTFRAVEGLDLVEH
jgi:hypothetical protein